MSAKLIRFGICVAFALPCFCQSCPPAQPNRSPSKSAPEIPTYQLDFEGNQPVPGVSASPVMSLPTQCTPDGTIYLDMLDPRDIRRHIVYGIGDDKAQVFSTGAIPGLHVITVLDISAAPSMIGFLLQAAKNNVLANNNSINQPDKKPQRHNAAANLKFYIATFDRDGNYKEAIELPLSGPVFRFAILPSGEFLVLAPELRKNVPKLMLLSSDGDLERSLDVPELLQSSAADTATHTRQAMAAASVLGSILFMPHNGNVLVWRPGSTGPVLEVQPGGGIREIPLMVPRGYTLADFVSSNDLLIAHFKPANAKDGVALNLSDYAYYEVNPSDGSLIATLSLSGKPTGIIACEHDGEYTSFSSDANNRLIRLVAR